MDKYFFSVGDFFKKFFRERVWKISIDLGLKCVHGKCIYCNETSFIPKNILDRDIDFQIRDGVNFLSKRYGAKKFIGYLQSGTNTAVSPEFFEKVLKKIISYDEIVSISIGTRPDYLEEDIVKIIEKFSKEIPIFIELGLQSAHDKTLSVIKRGHNFETFLNGVEKLSKVLNVLIVTHMIVGLLGESEEDILESFKLLSKLPLNGVKIHHLQVVRNTPLFEMYEKGEVKVFECVEDYIDILVKILEILPPHFVIHRLYGDIPDDLLVAPRWKIDKNSFRLKLEQKFLERNSFQGKFFKG